MKSDFYVTLGNALVLLIGLLSFCILIISLICFLFPRWRKGSVAWIIVSFILFGGSLFVVSYTTVGYQASQRAWQASSSMPAVFANTVSDMEVFHVVHLAEDPSASLNPAFTDEYDSDDSDRKMVENDALSAAGYPLVMIKKAGPICTDPFQVQLAMDLIVARHPEQVAQVPTCLLLPVGTEAEWTKPDLFENHEVELRIPRDDRIPITGYGPTPVGDDQPFFGWFVSFSKK